MLKSKEGFEKYKQKMKEVSKEMFWGGSEKKKKKDEEKLEQTEE